MCNQVRYSICIVLFLLLSIVAIEINISTPVSTLTPECQYLVSEQAANNRATLELIHIHTVSTVSENITIDHNSYDLKFIPKTNGKHYNRFEQTMFLGNYHYTYLHPNNLGYYIYQLHKIII